MAAVDIEDNLQHHDTQELDMRPALERGLDLCRRGEWKPGLDLLWKLSRKEHPELKLPATFFAYTGYGTARYHGNRQEGLRLCRHAVKLDPTDPETHLCLARVYLSMRNRKRAVKALERGLKIRPGSKLLRAFQKEIGYRRPPVLPFLPRSNGLNKWLGMRRHLRELERESAED